MHEVFRSRRIATLATVLSVGSISLAEAGCGSKAEPPHNDPANIGEPHVVSGIESNVGEVKYYSDGVRELYIYGSNGKIKTHYSEFCDSADNSPTTLDVVNRSDHKEHFYKDSLRCADDQKLEPKDFAGNPFAIK